MKNLETYVAGLERAGMIRGTAVKSWERRHAGVVAYNAKMNFLASVKAEIPVSTVSDWDAAMA